MAPVTGVDHATVIVAFRVDTNHYRVFQILNWGASAAQTVTINGGKASCTCPVARMVPNCDHVKAVMDRPKYSLDKGGVRDAIGAHDTLASDGKGRKESLTLYIQPSKSLVKPLAMLGDVSANNLIWAATKGVTPQIQAIGGELDPNRIYLEMEASLNKGKKLIDVISAGGQESDPSEVVQPVAPASKPTFNLPPRVKPIWETIKRPDPSEFYVDKDVWVQLVYAIDQGSNILLTGPSGCGKSEVVGMVTEALGKQLASFNMGAMSEPRSSLIGNVHYDPTNGTKFYKSRFVEAVVDEKNEGFVVLLDECTRSEKAAANILLPLLDRQGYLSLDESEDNVVVKKNPKTSFVATANIGMEYTGTEAMDAAFKNRFGVIIDMDFPPKEAEIKVLEGRCPGLKNSQATRLVNIASEQRRLAADGDFIEKLSTRQLIEAGKQIGMGMEPKVAIKFCLENTFSNDGGESSERTQFRQIVQKF
jgi:MoxR-like ATPase